MVVKIIVLLIIMEWNRTIGENCININNFLNNKCVNIYVMWYLLLNFLLGGRDTDIIDLNYKKDMGYFV